ncbi:890_t:CDS:2, partial [Acaulospora morrowiae]
SVNPIIFDVDKPKIPVELFVMSRCPDAVMCESVLSDVLKQVNEISNFTTNYIATLDDSAPYGAYCKHANIECV